MFNTAEVSTTSNSAKLANAAFLTVIFFSFFGTSLPFRPEIETVEEIGTSNLVNQIFYSLVFILAVFSLIPVKEKLSSLILKEKFLTLFLLWCTLTLIWSDFSLTAAKRLFQIFTVVLAGYSFLLHDFTHSDLLRNIKYIMYPYLVISILSCLLVPGALDPNFKTWRGLATDKNNLGQIGLACTVFSYMIYKNEEYFYSRMTAIVMLTISILLLIGSMSSTSIIILAIILCLAVLYWVSKIFEETGYAKIIAGLIIVTFAVAAISVIIFAPEVFNLFTELFGKDSTFSGRTDLWTYISFEISKHLWLGTGYQSFWLVENVNIEMLYKVFVWLPNQAHNGYLDIINEVGLIGFFFFLLFLGNYFYRALKIKNDPGWKWFLIIAVVSNMQESSFFRPGRLMNFLIILTYQIAILYTVSQSQQKNSGS
jgi:O-antigen ligase